MNHLLSRLVRSVSRVNSVTQKVVSKRFASLTVTRHPIPRLGRHNTPFDCRAQTFQTPFGRLTDVPSASGPACRRESEDAAIVSLDDRWEGGRLITLNRGLAFYD